MAVTAVTCSMTLDAPLAGLGQEPFVLLTAFRRDGRAVPTPIWIAVLDDHLVVSTPEGNGNQPVAELGTRKVRRTVRHRALRRTYSQPDRRKSAYSETHTAARNPMTT